MARPASRNTTEPADRLRGRLTRNIAPARTSLTFGRGILESYESPEEVVARALETLAEQVSTRSGGIERHQAVEDMLEFAGKHRFTLGEGLRIRDLIHEDHKR